MIDDDDDDDEWWWWMMIDDDKQIKWINVDILNNSILWR